MTQICVYQEVTGLFCDLRSCGERAIRSKEAEKNLSCVYCRSPNNVHCKVGFGAERSKTWQQGFGLPPEHLKRRESSMHHCELGNISCRMCSTL